MTTLVTDPADPVFHEGIHDLALTLVPMLADTNDVTLAQHELCGGWVADTKLDGVRAIAAMSYGRLTMRNRVGRVMDNYPDLQEAADGILDNVILDGEIIAESGKFQDIAARDKRRGAKMLSGMAACPAYFVAFDILWHPEVGDTRRLPYSERRRLLVSLDLAKTGGGRWFASAVSSDEANPFTLTSFYDQIRSTGGEGVVLKRLSARYEPGRRNSWLKIKSRFSITMIGTGYEAGKGACADFGAMFLGLVDEDGKLRDMGRVGSGFTFAQRKEMKALFDAAEGPDDLPIVEIGTFNLTREGKLRMPIYLEQRTDVTWESCSTAQLDQLPVT